MFYTYMYEEASPLDRESPGGYCCHHIVGVMFLTYLLEYKLFSILL